MHAKPVRRGFTLIELLVVIAIIAILAAILFPVFAQAREKARATQCLSNLKQLATAVQMYAQDNGEKLPGAISWGGALGVTGKVFDCPTSSKKGSANDPDFMYLAADGPNGGAALLSGRALASFLIPGPSETPMIIDGKTGFVVKSGTSSTGTANAIVDITNDVLAKVDKRHNKNANCAFVDGHVALLKGADMNTGTFSPCVNPSEVVTNLTDLIIDAGDLLHKDMGHMDPLALRDQIADQVMSAFGTTILMGGPATSIGMAVTTTAGKLDFVFPEGASGPVTLAVDGTIPNSAPVIPEWWQLGAGGSTFQSTFSEVQNVSTFLRWPPIDGLNYFTTLLNTLESATAVGTPQVYTLKIVPNGDFGMKRMALIVNSVSLNDGNPNTNCIVTGGITSVQIDSNVRTLNNCQVQTKSYGDWRFARTSAVGITVPVRLGHPITVTYFIRKDNAGTRGGCSWMFTK